MTDFEDHDTANESFDDSSVRGFLGSWQAPKADPAAKQASLAALYQELAANSSAEIPPAWAAARPRWSMLQVWLILQSQIRLVHRWIWAGTALILLLGLLVTLASNSTSSITALPFVLAAPIIAALGAALLYGDDTDPPLELQLSTPIPPRAILLARLALLFCFNLGGALIGSIILAVLRSDITFMPLVLSWLAPMTALSAFAFLCSVVLFDAALSAIISLLIWMALAWRHLGGAALPPAVSALFPDLWSARLQPALFLAALAAVLFALFLADREIRWANTGEN
ncbi:MAG: hypothetical protein IAE89_06985 [Anaerolineae bacterium]|nr:hypothetical protein [Anaerolineae bacterium]